jgi:UDPglucose 6-dehydrogenase
MRVGWVGLGKLGLPCALACESKGHDVRGVDPDPGVARTLSARSLPYIEEGADALLASTRIELVEIEDLVAWAELIFVAVQTPHGPEFEGVLPMPEKCADFDYRFLVEACQILSAIRWGCTVQNTVGF